MAIPSGSGTEVLKQANTGATPLNATSVDMITGVANHIYTILSIVFCEQANSSTLVDIRVQTPAAVSVNLAQEIAIGARETFVWNDKIVLVGTDKLNIYNTGSNLDIWVSYIDQDWT